MNRISSNFQRLIIASALATGILSAGAAASAQTLNAPAAPVSANATTVSMSNVDAKAKRQNDLEQTNAEARRVEFRYQGTSF
jgi:hypothetical protein